MDFVKYLRGDKIFTSTLKRDQAMLLPTVSFCPKKKLKMEVVRDSGLDPAIWLMMEKSNVTFGNFSKEHWQALFDNATFALDEVVSEIEYFAQIGDKKNLQVMLFNIAGLFI